MPKRKTHKASYTYESFDEMLDIASDKSLPDWESVHDGSCESVGNAKRMSWCRNTSLDEAIQLAKFGWKEGADMMSRELELARKSTQFERLPDYEYDVAGYIPNVPLYVSGSPTHMMSPIGSETSSKPTIEIMVNLSASCGINAERMAYKGAGILSLVDKLEDSGLSCHVTCTEYVNKGSSFMYWEFPIKKAGIPMDIDRCAFAIIHPALLRRIMFRMMELDNDAYDIFHYGYGRPADVPQHMRTGKIYFPMTNNFNPYSVEEAVNTAVEMYEHQTNGKDWNGVSV